MDWICPTPGGGQPSRRPVQVCVKAAPPFLVGNLARKYRQSETKLQSGAVTQGTRLQSRL